MHVAQSVYHDIIPAKTLGLKTVWVKRKDAASTPVVPSEPDLEVPGLKTLADIVRKTLVKGLRTG